MTTHQNHFWQADHYHHHSCIQNEAAIEMLQYIQFKGHEKVLDVGCGDGKITAKISTIVPHGFVLGIDNSLDMIKFAQRTFPRKTYPNLDFSHQDAQQLFYEEEFDLIFSSFALQWFPDHSAFFQGAHQSLKSVGYLAITVPLGISFALEQSIETITTRTKWSSFFQKFSPGVYFKNYKELEVILSSHHFQPLRFVVVPQSVNFPSREDFEKYVMPWFSYLDPLPKHLKPYFFKEIIDTYLEEVQILPKGEVSFEFSRIDMICSKT